MPSLSTSAARKVAASSVGAPPVDRLVYSTSTKVASDASIAPLFVGSPNCGGVVAGIVVTIGWVVVTGAFVVVTGAFVVVGAGAFVVVTGAFVVVGAGAFVVVTAAFVVVAVTGFAVVVVVTTGSSSDSELM